MADETRTSQTAAAPADGGAGFWWRVTFIAALGLSLRLLFVWTIPTQPVSDFAEYLNRAENISRWGSLQGETERPSANHPPLYVMWLALFVSRGSDPLIAAKLANCVLAALTIFIGAGLARKLWSPASG